MKYLALISFIFFSTKDLYACDTGKLPIGQIKYTGLVKTEKNVIKREFELSTGDCADPELLNLALQRVRNTNLFTKVDIDIKEELSTYNINLTVVERWTLIPIFKFGGGGGVSFFTLGLYDPHIFGKNLEVGAQYESLGGAPSQVVWFRKPRLFGKRLRVGGDIWNVTRNRLLYNEDRKEVGGFTLIRQRVNLFADYEIIEYVKPYIAIDYQMDKTSDKSVSDRTRVNNITYGFNPDSKGTYLITRLGIYLGRIDIHEELFEGQFLDFQIEPVHNYNDHSNFLRSKVEVQYAKRLPLRANFAQKLIASSQATNDLSQLYYLGSIQDVRGLLDSQFQTNRFVSLNTEYRIPSIVRSYILQHAFFVDAITFNRDDNWNEAFSAGTGVRYILPNVYRLNIRLDWAKSFGYGNGSAISFGLQQFF